MTGGGPGDGTRAEPPVCVRGLRKRYGRRLALAGIDLSLDDQQIVGIVGPDGAGKTTLLRALAGLLEVEAASARVLGYELRRDVTELKARIGYVTQAFSLQRDLSVIEHLRFTGRLHRLPRDQFEQRATELLRRTGLTPFADRTSGALSGGMRQKLAVANALLAQPPLLLLDEPTAGVDVHNRALFWERIQDAANAGVTVFVTTHFLEEVEYCDWAAFIDAGRLIANDTPEALRRRYAGGYTVEVDAPAPARARAATLLASLPGSSGAGGEQQAVTVPSLDAPVLAVLDRLAAEIPDARVRVRQPPMTEVFRRVLSEAGGV